MFTQLVILASEFGLRTVLAFAFGFTIVCAGCGPHGAGEEHRRAACASNLTEIGMALLEYRNAEGHFPPSVIRSQSSTATYSWRVAILPYLGERRVYDAYNRNEAWNSAANAEAATTRPSVYACPSDQTLAQDGSSYFMIVSGPTDGATSATSISQSESILVVEVKGENISWTEPRDIQADAITLKINDSSRLCISSAHPGGAHVLHCDGSVEFLDEAVSPQELQRTLGIQNSDP